MKHKTLIFFLIAIFFRVVLVSMFSYSVNQTLPEKTITTYFGSKANDYNYFIPPAEKFYTEGDYSYRDNLPFAGRMPGYAFLYLLFRFFSSPEIAILFVIIFQTIIGGVASVLLAKSSELLFQHKHSFFIAFFFSLLYPASIFFDYQTLTEGLTLSLISIAIYFTLVFFKKQTPYSLFIAGLLLVWAFFLRPFIGVLFPIWGIAILCKTEGNFTKRSKYAIIWAIPFFVFTGLWTIRNYNQFQQFIPIETSGDISYGKAYSKGWLATRSLITSWGGEAAYFEPGSEAEWFRKDTCNFTPPLSKHFFDQYPISKEELIGLKKDYQKFLATPGFDSILDAQIVSKASLLHQRVTENQSLLVKARIQISRMQRLTIRFGSAYMPKLFDDRIDLILRLFFSLSYFVCLFFAIVGGGLYFKKYGFMFVPIILQLIALLYVSSILEFRYFLPMMPFVILLATIGVAQSIELSKKIIN